MNDDFLRRLRPTPRAAFVHDLKGRLDRLPRTQTVGSAPVYLRTLLIALLIGGAAFAVTMMSMRRESVLVRVKAPVSEAPLAAERAPVTVASPVVKSKDPELSPAITREVRGNAERFGAESAPDSSETPAVPANAAGATRGAADAPSPVIAGIAVAGEGIRFIEGAGGAFPYRLYKEWSDRYRDRGGVRVDYVTMGSGGGLKLLLSRSVTFAAIDDPMGEDELKASGLFQFPVVAGGVVPIVRLDGVSPSQIKLDGGTLARIYLGEISHWNEPAIQKLNPDLPLPGTRITLAYRQDGSASTRVLTDYLARYNAWFKARYGAKSQIDISPGAAVRGDDGMADLVDRTDGAIGYVDYLYSKQHGIEPIRLYNQRGRAVSATPESLQSALSHADSLGASGFGASFVDLPGEQTWPMASASFAVMQSRVNRPQTAAAVQFFDWAYRNGSQAATQLGYVPVPPTVADRVRESWAIAFGKGVPPASSQGR